MKTEYIDHLGTDLTVVNAARVSFDKESGWSWKVDEEADIEWEMEGVLKLKDTKLIHYLAKHNHFTPFTHCVITLRETVPIFVARQRFKHTVGFTYNETSRRYVDDAPEFYVPDVWRKRAENAKQGSSDEVITKLVDLDDSDYISDIKDEYVDLMNQCAYLYTKMLDNGVAPEQARMVLPQSMYTSYYVTGSLFAFARAYNLRSEESAQKEIQELAISWKNVIEPLFPVSWAALTEKE